MNFHDFFQKSFSDFTNYFIAEKTTNHTQTMGKPPLKPFNNRNVESRAQSSTQHAQLEETPKNNGTIKFSIFKSCPVSGFLATPTKISAQNVSQYWQQLDDTHELGSLTHLQYSSRIMENHQKIVSFYIFKINVPL